MKHHHSPCGGRFLILGTACFGLICQAFAQNVIVPIETFSVPPIAVPQPVLDVIEVSPTIILSEGELRMRVHVLGPKSGRKPTTARLAESLESPRTGFRAGVASRQSRKMIPERVIEVVWSKNKSDWARLICAPENAVNSAGLLLDTVVFTDDVLDFGARLCQPGWLPLQSTSGSSQNLLVLKNGDPTPSQIARCKSGRIGSYLTPYLSSDAKTVKIRDGDLLILMELDQTHHKAAGFDYQDLALLVTFD